MRLAMRFILSRFARRSLSCSPCSRCSMRRIWRSTRDWLRCERFTNMASSLPRSAVSLAARRNISVRMWLKARPTSPISSEESTSMGSTSEDGTPWPLLPLMWRISSGSRTSSRSSAPARSLRIGLSTDPAATAANHNASARMTIATTVNATADKIALSRSELPDGWVDAVWVASAMRTTQKATTATATDGIMTSSIKRERTRQFFSSRREPLCAAGPWRERWWLPPDELMLPGRASCPAAGTGSRRNAEPS